MGLLWECSENACVTLIKFKNILSKMEFLSHMTGSDWAIVILLDIALVYVGFLAGEDTEKNLTK